MTQRKTITGKVAPGRPATKRRRFPEGKPNFPKGNPICPVMQKVKGSLKGDKPARELHFLTDQGLSTCQKLMSGHRRPNGAMYEALFQNHLIIDAILGLTEGATDPTARAVRKAIKRLAHEQAIARIDAGGDE